MRGKRAPGIKRGLKGSRGTCRVAVRVQGEGVPRSVEAGLSPGLASPPAASVVIDCHGHTNSPRLHRLPVRLFSPRPRRCPLPPFRGPPVAREGRCLGPFGTRVGQFQSNRAAGSLSPSVSERPSRFPPGRSAWTVIPGLLPSPLSLRTGGLGLCWGPEVLRAGTRPWPWE